MLAILTVDSSPNAVVRRVIQRFLTDAGYQCFETISGQATLDFLQDFFRTDPEKKLIVVRCCVGTNPGFVATNGLRRNLSTCLDTLDFDRDELLRTATEVADYIASKEPHE